MIRIEQLHKSYGSLHVLKGINLGISKGEVISIVGASGAGKSTLLHIIGTLDRADSGRVYFDNVEVGSLPEKKLSVFRNMNIGFVFQFHHLLPEFTALENVCIPAYIKGVSRVQADKKAFRLLEYMNLQHKAGQKPSQLSGGEQQRIAVARALIDDPAVVLADEPSGNLDSATALELHKLFFDLRRQLEQTFVIVTHNNQLAEMADRKITMKDGNIF
jgi:lipoprotein-releasing system ATP-binding protein